METNKKFKLNIVDLLIIALVLAAVVFIGVKVLRPGTVVDNTEEVYLTVINEEVANYVIEQTKIGDPAYDGSASHYLGVVTDIKVGDAMVYDEKDESGKLVWSAKEDYSSVIMTIKVNGKLGDYGVTVDETLYGVGHTFILHAGHGKYWLQVYDIAPVA